MGIAFPCCLKSQQWIKAASYTCVWSCGLCFCTYMQVKTYKNVSLLIYILVIASWSITPLILSLMSILLFPSTLLLLQWPSIPFGMIKDSSRLYLKWYSAGNCLATYCRCGGRWCRASLRAGSESSCTVRCGPGPLRSASVWDPLDGAGPSRLSRSPSMTRTRRCPGSRTAWWHHCPFARTGS